jgi:hypothetical protein
MPKKRKNAVQESTTTAPGATGAPDAPQANGQGESVAGYFRQVFDKHPRLLNKRSNAELFKIWLQDHPGHETVPDKVKVGLQNIKSVLRQQRGKKGGRQKEAAAAEEAPAPSARPAAPKGALDRLEGLIDGCLSLARGLDPEGLGTVIEHLRQARNEVILQGHGSH